MNKKVEEIYSKLGANERAITDKIGNDALRNIFIHIIGLKLKLQWKGWLQYLIPVPIILLLSLLTVLTYFLFGKYFSLFFSAITIVLCLRVFLDIVTVKFKIRFSEPLPKRKDSLTDIELMQIRHSCRSYQTKKLFRKDYEELMLSVKHHLSEPKFSSESIRLEYISAPITVWPTVNASEFLVAIAPKEYNRLAILDVGKTLQKIVIDATRMGLGTCWIGPGADHKSITAQLGNNFNPEKDNIICVCAIGYESKYYPLFIRYFNKKMRSRLTVDSLFFKDYEMNPIPLTQEPFQSFEKVLNACKWAPSSYNGQTTRGIMISNNDKLERIDFVATTTSKYYAAVATGIWTANWEMGCDELGIEGHFKKLNEKEYQSTLTQAENNILIYDMSWILSPKKIEYN
jgi:nitroreductase